jgi:hypothetical protein
MNRPPKAKCASAFVGHPIHSSTPKTSATAQAEGKKRQFYKPLPKQFRRDGFDFRQIAREKNAAIYEQTWSGCHNYVRQLWKRVTVKDNSPAEIRIVLSSEDIPEEFASEVESLL